jgi:hypothetical protein
MLSDSSQQLWASSGILTTSCLRISLLFWAQSIQNGTYASVLCSLFLASFIFILIFVGSTLFKGYAIGWGTALQAGRPRLRLSMGHWHFPLIWSFRPHCDPRVGSASNGNEYQEHLLGSKGGRCVWLTTLLPSCSACLDILGVSTT